MSNAPHISLANPVPRRLQQMDAPSLRGGEFARQVAGAIRTLIVNDEKRRFRVRIKLGQALQQGLDVERFVISGDDEAYSYVRQGQQS